MGEEKHFPDIQVTELFLAKAGNDWSRTFVGTIKRHTNPDGSKFVVGRIPFHDHEIISNAPTDILLGEYLDFLVLFIVDYYLHELPSINYQIAGTVVNLN